MKILNQHQLVPSLHNLFDDFFLNEGYNGHSFSPSANIKESETGFTIDLAIPGLNKEDFNINLENNRLTVSAKKEENKEEQTEKYTRKEFNFSSFSRSFTLPKNINRDEISASYENGILALSIPKLELAEKQNKLIEIK